MNMKKFTAILLRSISSSDIAPVNIERYRADEHSFCVTTADDEIFLVKVGEVRWKEILADEENPELNVANLLGIEKANDFMDFIDVMVQKNPLLKNLLFSTWKMRELNLITDDDLDRIQKGIKQNEEEIFIDYIQQQKMAQKK